MTKMDDLLSQPDVSASAGQQIRGCYERLTEKLVTLTKLDEQILGAITDARRPREKIEMLECTERIEEKLSQAKYLAQTSHSVAQTSNSSAGKVKLPKIDLLQFDGKYTEWTSFWDRFQASVHTDYSLSSSQKLSYLKSSLKGEASKVVSSLSMTDDNYVIACGLICERYDNKRSILRARFQALHSYPSLKNENASALGKF